MIRITAKISGADRTSETFKRARRDVYQRARRGMKRAGEKTILPFARRVTDAKSPVAPSALVVKTTGTYAFLTCKTRKQGRILGYLNYGGTLTAPIIPRGRRLASGRGKKAIAFGGVVVSQVSTARKHQGQRFLERARDAGFPAYEQTLLAEIMQAFDPIEHSP